MSKSKIIKLSSTKERTLSFEKGLVLAMVIFVSAIIVTNYAYYKISIDSNATIYNLNIDEMNGKYIAAIEDYDEKIKGSSGLVQNWYQFCKNLAVRDAVDDYFANGIKYPKGMQ